MSMTDAPSESSLLYRIPYIGRGMWRHRKMLANLLSLVSINIVTAIVGFFTRVKIANVLGKEVYGDLSYAVAIGIYGLMFIQFGFEKSLVRELVHFPQRFGELVKASLALRLFLFLLFIGSLAATWPFLFNNQAFSWGMFLMVLATSLAAFQLQGIYDAWREMWRHALCFLVERSAYFLLIWAVVLIPALTLSLNMVGAFAVLAVLTGLAMQYRWAMPRVDFKPNKGFRPTVLFLMRSNVWIWLAVLAGLSLEYLNQIILKRTCGSKALGGYSACWTIMQIATLFLNQVGRIGFASTARHTAPDRTAAERLRFLTKYVLLMAGMGALIGLPCVLFSKEILLLFFRPEYVTAAGTLRILGFYPMFYGVYLVMLQYVISSRLQKSYFVVSVLVGILSAVLCGWLIPGLEGDGAALALLITVFCGCGFFFVAAAIQLSRHRPSR